LKKIADRENLTVRAATLAEMASRYREKIPHETVKPKELALDVSGRAFSKS